MLPKTITGQMCSGCFHSPSVRIVYFPTLNLMLYSRVLGIPQAVFTYDFPPYFCMHFSFQRKLQSSLSKSTAYVSSMNHKYLADSFFSLIRNIFLVTFFFHRRMYNCTFFSQRVCVQIHSVLTPALDEGEL